MAVNSGNSPKWGKSFLIDDGAGDGFIRLAQRSRKSFKLESRLEYLGQTGLEHLNLDAATMRTLRTLDPDDLQDTDLASIPRPIRWWANTYGIHTPAALIHDRFIGGEIPEGVTEQHIDRYFRFMLEDNGVRYIKRWIMWSATALRTRFAAGGWRRISVILWALLATAGVGYIGFALATGQWLIAALLAFPAPVIFSSLWGKQFGAGIVAAYAIVPWLLPPVIVSLVFLGMYAVAEFIASTIIDDAKVGSEPILWRNEPDRSAELRQQIEGLQDGEISNEATAF
ncbi:MAG: DUF1353 domain-containing protein [Acidimicrobiales bacterium]